MHQRFDYKFSQLIGTVYKKGNLVFSQDGQKIFSSVGNRISVFDLKNNRTETLPVENRYNLAALALSPNGKILAAINEVGEMSLISMKSRSLFHRHHFKHPISIAAFSPDGRYLALAKGSKVFLFDAPHVNQQQYQPLAMRRVFHPFYDNVLCLDWSSDSRVLLAGGQDKLTRVLSVERFTNHRISSLGGHTEAVVACFFQEDTLNAYTVSRNGELLVWEASLGPEELEPEVSQPPPSKKRKVEVEDDIVEAEEEVEEKEGAVIKRDKDTETPLFYKRIGKYFPKDKAKSGQEVVWCTSAALHKSSDMLATGFSNGVFVLHQMPNFTFVANYQMRAYSLTSLHFNPQGNWVAAGSEDNGGLLVWDWSNREKVLDQQGSFSDLTCVDYSPLGDTLVTGGHDGKAKLWDTRSSFRFATLSNSESGESSISGVAYSPRGNAVFVTYSNGLILAYNTKQYHCFRSFKAPRNTPLCCLTVNHTGELIAAATEDTYEILTWSVNKKGDPIDVMSGHTGQVRGLQFDEASSVLISTSQDLTCRIWSLDTKQAHLYTIEMGTEGLAVAIRPDGQQCAVSTLRGHILFYQPETSESMGMIEGLKDLEGARKESDLIMAKTSRKTLAFTTLSYTRDGECILAAGKSRYVCIYHIDKRVLLKKFEITQNNSLDGLNDFLSIRKITEFGNKALIEEREDNQPGIKPPLPKMEDVCKRSYKPELRILCVRFSPSERSWAAVTTEGLVVYSLDHNVTFNPTSWDLDITPASIKAMLGRQHYGPALSAALGLNETSLIKEVLEQVPSNYVETMCQDMSQTKGEQLLNFISQHLRSTPLFALYQLWVEHLYTYHPGLAHSLAHRRLAMEYRACMEPLIRIREYGTYTHRHLSLMPPRREKKNEEVRKEMSESSSESEDDF